MAAETFSGAARALPLFFREVTAAGMVSRNLLLLCASVEGCSLEVLGYVVNVKSRYKSRFELLLRDGKSHVIPFHVGYSMVLLLPRRIIPLSYVLSRSKHIGAANLEVALTAWRRDERG